MLRFTTDCNENLGEWLPIAQKADLPESAAFFLVDRRTGAGSRPPGLQRAWQADNAGRICARLSEDLISKLGECEYRCDIKAFSGSYQRKRQQRAAHEEN